MRYENKPEIFLKFFAAALTGVCSNAAYETPPERLAEQARIIAVHAVQEYYKTIEKMRLDR